MKQPALVASVLLIISLTGGLIIGCQSVSTTQGGAIGLDRKQLMSSLISSEQMSQASIQAYRETLTASQQKGKLNQDTALTQRVRGIAQRLVPHTAAFRPDAPKWQWEVNVITSDELNAWCMPGGKIAFYSGIITKLNLTDDEIAAIMGHEIAHALREHARERASQQMGTGLVIGVGAAAVGAGQTAVDLAQMVTQLTLSLPNSRLHETESDRIGVELAARAGYNPRAAISLWDKMNKASGNGPPQFLSTHPSPKNRMQDLEVYSRKVMPLYEQARLR
ncbi:MAG: M48 family metallopeptidase [Thiotrichales bacterium]